MQSHKQRLEPPARRLVLARISVVRRCRQAHMVRLSVIPRSGLRGAGSRETTQSLPLWTSSSAGAPLPQRTRRPALLRILGFTTSGRRGRSGAAALPARGGVRINRQARVVARWRPAQRRGGRPERTSSPGHEPASAFSRPMRARSTRSAGSRRCCGTGCSSCRRGSARRRTAGSRWTRRTCTSRRGPAAWCSRCTRGPRSSCR